MKATNLDQLLLATRGAGAERPSMEHLWQSSDGFGVSTATPLQIALCRLMSDVPLGELAEHPVVRKSLGVPKEFDMSTIPVANTELLLLAGIRTGKSMLSALAAFYWARHARIDHLSAGEVARVSVVSLTKDLADVVFKHLHGHLMARPGLKQYVHDQPEAGTLEIRHETGRIVEIKVVAGTRAGASLVARWSAGCIFDEAPRMVGADTGVVNLEDCRAAVLGRIIKGAKLMMIGSPWRQYGPAYSMFKQLYGRPGLRGTVVVRAEAPDLNPIHWTKKRCEDLRRADPDVHATDVEAKFGSDGTCLFATASLDKSFRLGELELPFIKGYEHVAAIDPATRGNAWTLVISRRVSDMHVEVVRARDWVGTKHKPLNPDDVFLEIARECARYGTRQVTTDQHQFDSLRLSAQRAGVFLVESPWGKAVSAWELYRNLQFLADRGFLSLPDVDNFREDLSGVVKVPPVKPGSPPGIKLMKNGTRHCDYAPALALSCGGWVPPPPEVPPEAPPMDEQIEDAEDAAYQQELEEMGRTGEEFTEEDIENGW